MPSRAARATAREVVWVQRAEHRAGTARAGPAGGRCPGWCWTWTPRWSSPLREARGRAHLQGQASASTRCCFLDNTGEVLSGRLRPGNAGANTAADHIDGAGRGARADPRRPPVRHRILIRTDSAGSTKAFLAHIRACATTASAAVLGRLGGRRPGRAAITALPEHVWTPALDADGGTRDGAAGRRADRAVVGPGRLPGRHPGHRAPGTAPPRRPAVPVRGTRRLALHRLPHRHPAPGRSPFLEVRHRAHARVEDRIRCGKDTGFGRFPSREFAINAAWLDAALTAADLIAWTRLLLLDGELANAEPKRLRYRLLHTAARLTRGGRRRRLRIAPHWPWAATSPPPSPASPHYPAQPAEQPHPTRPGPRRTRPPRRASDHAQSTSQPRNIAKQLSRHSRE